MSFKNSAIFIGLILIINSSFASEKLPVSHFAQQDLSHWNEKEFNRLTIYSLTKEGDTTVLKAHANKSASGLFKEQSINLAEYPFINWRWKTTSRLNVSNERSKQGDDYSARIYIIKDGGFFFWKSKALNYVWARHEPKNTVWPNAYAPDNAMMIAVRSQDDALNTWFYEKRNLANDYQLAFGESIEQVDAIAIMTDTDDSQDETTSYFGDIYFSKK